MCGIGKHNASPHLNRTSLCQSATLLRSTSKMRKIIHRSNQSRSHGWLLARHTCPSGLRAVRWANITLSAPTSNAGAFTAGECSRHQKNRPTWAVFYCIIIIIAVFCPDSHQFADDSHQFADDSPFSVQIRTNSPMIRRFLSRFAPIRR